MRIDVVTIFPEFFGVLDVSLLGRARQAGVIDVRDENRKGAPRCVDQGLFRSDDRLAAVPVAQVLNRLFIQLRLFRRRLRLFHRALLAGGGVDGRLGGLFDEQALDFAPRHDDLAFPGSRHVAFLESNATRRKPRSD